MAEKPILFSGPMVRAILDGRKTQTRRVVKNNRNPMANVHDCQAVEHVDDSGYDYWVFSQEQDTGHEDDVFCPYGSAGDHLWVRETWYPSDDLNEYWGSIQDWPECEKAWWNIEYRADGSKMPFIWRPSIHMPRWASRLQLKVTGVRVERVQDISEEDAKAEGVSRNSVFDEDWWQGYREINGDLVHQVAPGSEPPEWMIEPKVAPAKHLKQSYRDNFARLWDSINADRGYSWESNPYVWVVEFERAAPVGAEPS